MVGVVLALAIGAAGCGGDDETTSAGDSAGASASQQVDPQLGDLAEALEGEGLDVTPLAKSSLDGAKAGVEITGSQSGTARVFSSEAEAQAYADKVAKQSNEKTMVVVDVVFEGATQQEADAFAAAYEG